MGKVLSVFTNGFPGAVTRSVDDIIISVRNNSESDIPFGAPVFIDNAGASGAVPFDPAAPQEFSAFLGFAVRVADKTPDTYPRGQFFSAGSPEPQGVWKPNEPMDVLVRGTVAVEMNASGARGGSVYVRKTDGRLTPSAGASGTTLLLENVRIRTPRAASGNTCAEVVVNRRNIL